MDAKAETTEKLSDDDLITSAMEALHKPPPAAPAHAMTLPSPPSTLPDMPTATSPTLEALDPNRRPKFATACEGCPNSVWFTSPTEVKCYCRVMYLVTWSVKEPNQITACDGVFVGQDD